MLYALVAPQGDVACFLPAPAVTGKGFRCLPVEDVRPEAGPDEILDGPENVVQADKVVRTWTARPAPPPLRVSMAQARVALSAAGLLASVDALVTGRGDAAMQQAWEYGSEVTRDGAMVAAISQALGWSDAFVDDLFRQAAAVRL
jgi:hypothetical protein